MVLLQRRDAVERLALTVAGLAERNGIPFHFLRYTKIAFPLMVVHVAISHVYLLWRYL